MNSGRIAITKLINPERSKPATVDPSSARTAGMNAVIVNPSVSSLA